jgi:hypothetical protein
VLSLTSFLPPHVLARLTKAQALRPAISSSQRPSNNQAASDDSDDESDDEKESGTDIHPLDDGRAGTGAKIKPGGRGRSAGASMAVAADNSLSLLLRELQESKPAATVATTAPKQQPRQQQSLGQAFVSLSSETTMPRRTNNDGVVDVHHPTTTTSATTTVKSSSERADTPASTAGSRTMHPAPPGRSLSRPVKAAPTPTLSLRVGNQGNQLPLPSSNVQHATIRPAAHANYDGVGAFVAATEAPNDYRSSKKRSRQELERALRGGNVQVLQNPSHAFQVDVQSLQQADPAEYAPDPESAHERSLRQSQQHGIRVAPTLMYDASTGTAESSVAGSAAEGGAGPPKLKGRGKNQIHHVVAAAAQLEMQRARQTPSASGSATHRANAKAKYGW